MRALRNIVSLGMACSYRCQLQICMDCTGLCVTRVVLLAVDRLFAVEMGCVIEKAITVSPNICEQAWSSAALSPGLSYSIEMSAR